MTQTQDTHVAGVTLPPHPQAYLVGRERVVADREWPVELPVRGTWKVTGKAGSGVTSFLIDTAVERIRAGADPAGVVLLTASKESGARVRAELSDRLAVSGFVADEPIVRSIHSLAFALVRLGDPAAEENPADAEPIRLISGAEQDFAIRELLQGHATDGGGTWPAELRPALPMVGFARQLRDFLLRAVERTLTPDDLRTMGKRHGIPVWSAAGDFLAEYQDVMALYGARSYSASELVAHAVRAPLPKTWHTVIVDDAQHLDPASGQLVEQLAEGAELTVIGGDEEQSVFRFRGASPLFFRGLGSSGGGIGAGAGTQVIDLGATKRNPSAEAVIAPSSAVNNAAVVDRLRRWHLEDGLAWRDMGVVVRSVGMIEPLRRALLQAGVPVAVNPTDVVLAEQRIVAAMLLGLKALTGQLSMAQWRELLLGPVGGTDPVTLRRLLRGLRRWRPDSRAEVTLSELLAQEEDLPDFGSTLTDRELQILNRIRDVLDAGRAALAEGGSVEEVLWAIWSATKLADSLMAIALRGGAAGSQADRDLDAMMALFDAAGDFTERRPSATVESFIAHIEEQELPTGVRDRRTATPDAVPLLTAHGAAGREFARVIVSGVQELSWPTLSETGTLMRQEDLVDLVDEGIDPATPVSHIADRLKEERHLFHMAVSRATDRIVVTAVHSEEGDEVVEPSRFIAEFAADYGIVPQEIAAVPVPAQELVSAEAAAEAAPALFDSVGGDSEELRSDAGAVRVLAVEDIVAELRRALTDGDSSEQTRLQAARQLARLADAGIAAADPGQWWGTTEPSISEPLPRPARLSPSRIEGLLKCPMSGVLEREIAPAANDAMTRGTLIHYFFEALGNGVDRDLARADTIEAYRALFSVPPWKEANDLAEFTTVLDRCEQWIDSTRGTFSQLGVEVPVHVEVVPGLAIGGRIDRLEREGDADGDGPVQIVDLKTGKSATPLKEAEEHPQLLSYQLALSRGVWRDGAVVTAGDGEKPLDVGGGILFFPAAKAKKPTVRTQSPKDSGQLAEFAELISPLIDEMTGPELRAVTGDHCAFCQLKSICPAQPEGEVTTRG
ncbi:MULTISPECIES: ATP-dependent DNA helicase [unclassified Corynebacterium]|uniref:ATP-dependent DNA helicase n=1 Tax=unclassified Corynebacterium TaxID=2624378 RepID=UPI00264F554D|nr:MULTISPECIES: ATP-dependent DNA helicase [unclassified Corynebacterium]MDN8595155.1 ATP-dependent DNA helicase [Corynebacterium sp. P4_F2]WKK56611.1 ATP-dependent DNA helicase [Corynebacterium sp. P4-C1]WKK64048.1 ATP-dependent DNA helicase [Corynebacterium sp. P8-C1]